jgi:hypothetical protein
MPSMPVHQSGEVAVQLQDARWKSPSGWSAIQWSDVDHGPTSDERGAAPRARLGEHLEEGVPASAVIRQARRGGG